MSAAERVVPVRDPTAVPLGRGPRAVLGLVGVLARRWALWLGTALGFLSVDGPGDGVGLGTALALAGFGYLLVALLDRPGLTWPLVLVLGVVVVGLRVVGVAPVPVFAVAGGLLAVAAVALGSLRQSVLHLLQAPAAWLFGGAALVATLVSVEAGSLVVAVGLLGHAVWDVVLWRSSRAVVSRSFAEWCCAFDAVVGAGILLALV